MENPVTSVNYQNNNGRIIDFLGYPVSLGEISHLLKQDFMLRKICYQVVSSQVILRAASDRNLTITADEIQEEANRHRREYRLEKASDTFAWLQDELITPEDWERGIRDRLLAQKLAEHLFSKDVERIFVENRLNYDRASVYQIVVPYIQIAQELFYQIEEDEISFFEAAHLYDMSIDRRRRCGYEGLLHRWEMIPELAALVFGATPGHILPPVHTDEGYHLILIEEFLPAELTPTVRAEIIQELFKQWLESEVNYWIHMHQGATNHAPD